jgi:hypothetical protein
MEWKSTREVSEPRQNSLRKFTLFFFLSIMLLSTIIVYPSASHPIDSWKRAIDPSYQEALRFIASDQTDKNQYVLGKYVCGDFAADFQRNALRAGYRCGFVLISFAAHLSHALNCFNTTDRGLIYVEPQEDKIVTVRIGRRYWNQITLLGPCYNDTVTELLVLW